MPSALGQYLSGKLPINPGGPGKFISTPTPSQQVNLGTPGTPAPTPPPPNNVISPVAGTENQVGGGNGAGQDSGGSLSKGGPMGVSLGAAYPHPGGEVTPTVNDGSTNAGIHWYSGSPIRASDTYYYGR